MEWEIKYQEEHGVVYARPTGFASEEAWLQMAAECVAIANEHDSNKFLMDERDLTLKTSISEIYDWPGSMDESGIIRGNKMAFLYCESPSNKSDYRFFETVSRNRGYNFRVFEEQQKAMAWLITDK